VYVITKEPRKDARGFFVREFCIKVLKDSHIPFRIVQINKSMSVSRGTIRGMHYQKAPYAEDKIVQCLSGAIFDVALDLRPSSPTFGKWYGIELTDDNDTMLLVPKGCAHGFQALKDNTVVQYFVSQYYSPEAEGGIRWDDPAFGISWPIKRAVLSEKDSSWPPSQIKPS